MDDLSRPGENAAPLHAHAARLCHLALRNQDADDAFRSLLGALAALARDPRFLDGDDARQAAVLEQLAAIAVLFDDEAGQAVHGAFAAPLQRLRGARSL